MLISKWPPGSHIGCFGFRPLTLVWLWISTPNLSGTIHVYTGRSLLIFSDVPFKMAAWRPYWIFRFRTNFSLALNINFKLQWQSTYVYGSEPIDFQWLHFLNGCLVAILDFSVSGWHGFGSVTQVCFGISVSNFMCMSFVAVGRSLMIVSYVASKMAALWFWTMFNYNLPIAHCHPLLWGGGILVDHWSTISSWFWNCMITCQNLHFGKYVGLTVCLSVCLLSVCLLSVCLSSVCLSVRLSVCLSVSL